MSDERALTTMGTGGELSVQEVGEQVQKIQHLMREIMHEDEHFGKIPGTDKPTLLKAGAEKLGFTFRLMPSFEVVETDMGKGHREYRVKCTLTHAPSGIVSGEGVGLCSTMESKYRYRNVADFEVLDDPIPDDYRERKAEYRKRGLGAKKVNGQWAWVKFGDSERSENPDIADVYNTVLKMAKKRAHVDAMITATAASDIFTQDMEDVRPPKAPEQPRDVSPPRPEPEQPERTMDAGMMQSLRKMHGKVVKWAEEREDGMSADQLAYIKGLREKAIDHYLQTGDDPCQWLSSGFAKIEARWVEAHPEDPKAPGDPDEPDDEADLAELDAVAGQAFDDDKQGEIF